jgi:hypothetical protein
MKSILQFIVFVTAVIVPSLALIAHTKWRSAVFFVGLTLVIIPTFRAHSYDPAEKRKILSTRVTEIGFTYRLAPARSSPRCIGE